MEAWLDIVDSENGEQSTVAKNGAENLDWGQTVKSLMGHDWGFLFYLALAKGS